VIARMELVLRCVSTRDKLHTVVQHLITVSKEDSPLASSFLVELYMKIPASLESSDHSVLPSWCPLVGESAVDSISHTLLSSLSAVQQGKQWTVKMQEYELAARKLVSSHPVLFLRNLPLLASSLQGRTNFDYHVFRVRNHLTLFTIHLGLLELCRPHVFHSSCLTALDSALSTYMDMVDAYFQRRETFYYLTDRLVQFLSSWQAAGGQAAVMAAQFLRKHSPTLLRLHSAPGTNKMESLRSLVAGLAPALHSQSGEEATREGQGGSQLPRWTEQDCMDPELSRMLAELQVAETDRVLPLLRDLENAANPRPNILLHFQDELTYHISSSSLQVRSLAYTLLLKHLKQRPSAWESLLPSYLAALHSGQEEQVEAALQHLPEMTVLSQQQGGDLLSSVFRLGIYSNLSTTQHINSAISRLNMQLGT